MTDVWNCLQALQDAAIALEEGGLARCLNEAARALPVRLGVWEGPPEPWWQLVLETPEGRRLAKWAWEARTGGTATSRNGWIPTVPNRGRNGNLAWDVTVLPGLQGGKASEVVLLVRDRTEDRRLMEALRREQEFSQKVLEATGALVVVVDRDYRIVKFNRACEELTGYRAEEVLGRSLPDLLLVPEERPGGLQVIENLEAGQYPNQHENDWVTRGGERRRILWTNTVIQGQRGEVLYLVGTGFDVTEQRRREAVLRHQVLHDPLTGLANRTLLEELLRLAFYRAERSPDYYYGLLFLDLDGFKEINDQHGHPFGDLVLKAVAERLRSSVRQSDTVVRFGGDEFVVLLEPIASENDLTLLADRILRTLREPMFVQGTRLVLTASIGAVVGQRGETSPGELLARADRAMYLAKRSGKSRSAFVPRPRGPAL